MTIIPCLAKAFNASDTCECPGWEAEAEPEESYALGEIVCVEGRYSTTLVTVSIPNGGGKFSPKQKITLSIRGVMK